MKTRHPHRLVALLAITSMSSAWMGGSSLHAVPLANQRPLAFEENRGQSDPRVRYLSRGPSYTLFLTASEAVLALDGAGEDRSGSVLRIHWAGGAASPRMTADGQLPGVTNYLTGDDPSRWRTGVPSWTRVHYAGVWPGIDMVFYGNPRQLEHDVVVAPGADPGRVRLGFDGAEELRIDAAGDLVALVRGEEVRLRRPVSWQEAGGVRRAVESGWRLLPGGREAGFRLAAYDPARPLVIDPVLVYSTFLGGSGYDVAADVAVDAEGSSYLIGETNSADFPLAHPVQEELRVLDDAFVTKLDASGALVYSTFLGSGGDDFGRGIAVDRAGSVYVTGWAGAANFPLVRPLASLPFGRENAFVAKLAPDGSSLVYSTLLGGSLSDFGWGIAVDSQGRAHVAGSTSSSDFPLVRPILPLPEGSFHSDAFVAQLSADGSSLLFSTRLGGSLGDAGGEIAIHPAGGVILIGWTESADFPVAHAAQPALAGAADAFVTRLDPSGPSLIWSTYLGGSDYEVVGGIAVDAAGNAYATGFTGSADFPTRNPLQPHLRGDGTTDDSFITKLDRAGALVYSTYLGGSGRDAALDVAVDRAGAAHVTGFTTSPDFPLVNPLKADCGPVGEEGCSPGDAFVAALSPSGASLIFSTYLGGDLHPPYSSDAGEGIAIDRSGLIHVAGWTGAVDFPTVDAFQPAPGGSYDAFLVRIALDGSPVCSAAVATPAVIRPPNGRMVPVSIEGVTDPDGGRLSIAITRITQDEPLAKKGQPDATGLGTSRPRVRASRVGRGDGRVYHLSFRASDSAGATCTGEVTVCVPHDQKKRTCGDGGPLVDSAGGR